MSPTHHDFLRICGLLAASVEQWPCSDESTLLHGNQVESKSRGRSALHGYLHVARMTIPSCPPLSSSYWCQRTRPSSSTALQLTILHEKAAQGMSASHKLPDKGGRWRHCLCPCRPDRPFTSTVPVLRNSVCMKNVHDTTQQLLHDHPYKWSTPVTAHALQANPLSADVPPSLNSR